MIFSVYFVVFLSPCLVVFSSSGFVLFKSLCLILFLSSYFYMALASHCFGVYILFSSQFKNNPRFLKIIYPTKLNRGLFHKLIFRNCKGLKPFFLILFSVSFPSYLQAFSVYFFGISLFPQLYFSSLNLPVSFCFLFVVSSCFDDNSGCFAKDDY